MVNVELQNDLAGGKDVISRARGASFWEWEKGVLHSFGDGSLR